MLIERRFILHDPLDPPLRIAVEVNDRVRCRSRIYAVRPSSFPVVRMGEYLRFIVIAPYVVNLNVLDFHVERNRGRGRGHVVQVEQDAVSRQAS